MAPNTSGIYRPPLLRIGKTPSYNEILPRLFLGDICIATNKEEIARIGITDMITVEIRPLSADDLAPTVKRYLFINIMDHSKQDILSHFNSSNDFIETALKTPSNKVYVHCVAGISRSATLVIAYIMKTRSMNYYEAFELVSQKRRVIDPNEGFVRQLTLYHKMNYTIDIGNMEYRRIVLEALVFEFRLISLSFYQTNHGLKTVRAGNPGASSIIQMPLAGAKSISNKNNVSLLFDQFYSKLHLQQVSLYPHIYDQQTAYRCNKCRAVVFYSVSVIENINIEEATPSTSSNAGSASTSRRSFDFRSNKDQSNKNCPFIYIEPQPWMSKDILERDGNLECYKCKRKLGKFDWTSGESCSCSKHNSHMNLNLFKTLKKKVDFGL